MPDDKPITKATVEEIEELRAKVADLETDREALQAEVFELTEVVVHENEPPREQFAEKPLPNEPKSDVKILAGGMMLRERIARKETPHGVSIIFTYTRLTDDDEVMVASDGTPLISDPHEVVFDGEGVQRVGEAENDKSLKLNREVAVARAVNHFKGLEKLPSLLADRLG